MSELRKAAHAIAVTAAEMDNPLGFIRAEVIALESGRVIDLAVAYIFGEMQSLRRGATLAVERAAVDAAREPRYGTKAWNSWAARPENAEAADRTRQLRADLREIDRQASARLHADLSVAMEKYADELKIAWTAELLDSEFALSDGTRVRWGEATREQHESRMAMHKRNAIAGAEGFARHQQAVALLDRSGAPNLYAARALKAGA